MRLVVAVLSIVALAFAAPAAADAPIVEPFGDEFTDVNPCTGEEMTVTFEGTAYIHEHGSRFVLRSERTITTSDGFVGRGTESVVENGQVFRARFADMMTNAVTGERFRARGVFVADLSTETVRVERFDLTCLTQR